MCLVSILFINKMDGDGWKGILNLQSLVLKLCILETLWSTCWPKGSITRIKSCQPFSNAQKKQQPNLILVLLIDRITLTEMYFPTIFSPLLKVKLSAYLVINMLLWVWANLRKKTVNWQKNIYKPKLIVLVQYMKGTCIHIGTYKYTVYTSI